MDLLFKKGATHGIYPVKIVHLDSGPDFKFTAQAMFVVPKKSFKKAHDRNKLKRRMKESYRMNKNNFYTALGDRKKILAFIYYSKKAETFETIQKAIKTHLGRIV